MTPGGRLRLGTGLIFGLWAGVTLLLVPAITGEAIPTPAWPIAVGAGSAVFVGLLWLWMRRQLRALPPVPAVTAHDRRLAHDFPVRLARACFVGAVGAGLGTAAMLIGFGRGLTAAMVSGVICYLIALLPVLGAYLLARRALRPHAAGPPGAGPIDGPRQSIAQRLTFAVQVPVVVCAAGLVLVQATDGQTYERAVDGYFVDRSEQLTTRIAAALPPEAAAAFLAERRPIPATAPRPIWPLTDPWPPLLLIALITLAALAGRALARILAEDLRAVGDALTALDPEVRTGEPTPDPGVALTETATIMTAFGQAVTGFARQRVALRQAMHDRRIATRAKARFLAHLSHELKSPLNSILGFTELLLGEIDGPLTARQHERLSILWRSGDSLLRFILALLDLARLESAGGLDTPAALAEAGLTPAPFDAAALVRSLRQQLRPDPCEAVRVSVTLSDGPTRCTGDVAHTARALLLVAGAQLDAVERGEAEIAVSPTEDGGLTARVRLVAAEGEAADRAHLVARWCAPAAADDPAPGRAALSVTPLDLLRRMADLQAGQVEVRTANDWPVVRLHLPAAV
ncbi:MAG: HAMP domain-containing histidine kinase [Myxococcales bacterium]|nr:HAMP domain-containing histidine kinase [Myxococcales bacterium]